MSIANIDAERTLVDVVTYDYQQFMHDIAEHHVFTALVAFFTVLTLFLEDVRTIFFDKEIDIVYTVLSGVGLVLFVFEFIVNCKLRVGRERGRDPGRKDNSPTIHSLGH